MKMFIDPKTGEARDPTPQELAEISKQQKQQQSTTSARPKPAPIQLPDGTVMVPMEPKYPVQACTNKDGTLTIDHECKEGQKESQGDNK
jgi:hypothetical protein